MSSFKQVALGRQMLEAVRRRRRYLGSHSPVKGLLTVESI